jgi:tRNA synthetases class I (C) catalytic domain
MSPLQLYNTRTRAKQTFVPADPSGRVGLFVCGPTVYDLPHLGHAKAYTQFDFLARSRGPAASPSRTCRTSPRRTTRSSAGRASCGSTRPSSRAATARRIWTTCGRAQRLRGRVRARQRLHRPSHQPDRAPAAGGRDAIRARSWSRSFIAWAVRRRPACRCRASARSRMPCRSGRTCSGAGCGCSRCVRPGICITRPPRRVQFGPQPAREVAVDAVLVGEWLDTVQALGPQPPRPDVHVAARVGLAHHGLTDQAGLRVFTRRRCRRQRRIASVRPQRRDLGRPESRASGPQRGTRRRSAHIRDASG